MGQAKKDWSFRRNEHAAAVCERLESRRLLAVTLPLDINKRPVFSPEFGNLTEVNGGLLFAADDGEHGPELWRSDGTAAGTVLVKDIRPGAGGSGPQNFTDINGTLYFGANDGSGKSQLWTSDGTEEGTVLLADTGPWANPGTSPY